jgi:tetratricopeptide (TPR) repeat protein
MILLLAALVQQAAAPAPPPAQAETPAAPKPAATPDGPIAGPPSPDEVRFHRCFEIAQQNPASAQRQANQWLLDGGKVMARECLGIAYANQGQWPAAAATFEAAARAAEMEQNDRAGPDWSQAGNAWLAAGKPDKAAAAFGAALASGMLDTKQIGETQLDRARALVAKNDLAGARADLDRALLNVPEDPFAWLLSATLARRMGDLPRAHKDIAEALKRAPKAPQVELEAGNIAARSGDQASAQAAWHKAVSLAPDSPAGRSAAQALKQFEIPGATPP